MRVVVALSNVIHFRHYDRALRELSRRGHDVEIVVNSMKKPGAVDEALRAFLADTPHARLHQMIAPRNRGWYPLLWRVREALNCGVYFRPGHPSSHMYQRWIGLMPRDFRRLARIPPLRTVMVARSVQAVLRRIESSIPVDPSISDWLGKIHADVVLASPCLVPFATEVEYLRAATALGIATVVGVASWDNLTTKGTFHHTPTVTLVWNDAMRDEAVSLHDVPAESIVITGAPGFDFWFDDRAEGDRESFCYRAGLDPSRPFITYVCSSRSITTNEVPIVRELVSAIRSHVELADLQILVRPHWLSSRAWEGVTSDDFIVFPSRVVLPDHPSARSDYVGTLGHSLAVVGINTSAFLDAACADVPCVTVMSGSYESKQTGLGHFHHLLRAEFIETAPDYHAGAEIVAQIRRGRDARASQRRKFVQTFVRGSNAPELTASEVTADAIEQAAGASGTRDFVTVQS